MLRGQRSNDCWLAKFLPTKPCRASRKLTTRLAANRRLPRSGAYTVNRSVLTRLEKPFVRLRRWSAGKRGQRTFQLSQARQEKWAVWVFVFPPLAVYLAMVVWPMVFLFYLSLNKWTGFGPKTFVGFSNYAHVLSDDKFWLAVQHNGLWAIATLIGTTTTGLALALLLARTRAWARGFFQVVYFLPQ